MPCIYLRNKCLAVCQDGYLADGTCSSKATEGPDKCVCVQERNNIQVECCSTLHAFLLHSTPSGEIWSPPSETPRSLWTSDHFHAKGSKHKWRVASLVTLLTVKGEFFFCDGVEAVKTLRQLLAANESLAKTGNALATRLHQLMWGSRRTRVQLECERECEKERD